MPLTTVNFLQLMDFPVQGIHPLCTTGIRVFRRVLKNTLLTSQILSFIVFSKCNQNNAPVRINTTMLRRKLHGKKHIKMELCVSKKTIQHNLKN